MTIRTDQETTPYALKGAFVLVVGAGLLLLDSRAPKAARWGVGLLAIYVTVRSLRKKR